MLNCRLETSPSALSGHYRNFGNRGSREFEERAWSLSHQNISEKYLKRGWLVSSLAQLERTNNKKNKTPFEINKAVIQTNNFLTSKQDRIFWTRVYLLKWSHLLSSKAFLHPKCLFFNLYHILECPHDACKWNLYYKGMLYGCCHPRSQGIIFLAFWQNLMSRSKSKYLCLPRIFDKRRL